MKKLFVLSTAFFTKFITLNLDYVLNIPFDTIVLLQENHKQSETYPYNVELYSDIDMCVSVSDYILIFNTPTIPPKTIALAEEKAKGLGKTIISLDYSKIFSPHKNTIIPAVNKSTPLILHLSISVASQAYGVEVLLNKILNKFDINFTQNFTHTTSNIFNELCEKSVLSETIANRFLKEADNADVIVLSKEIAIDDTFEDSINIISDFLPDVVIVQTDLKYRECMEIKKSILNKAKTSVDLIVSSSYYPLKDSLIIYCNDVKAEDTELIETNNFELTLEKKILSKLSYPAGVIPL